MKLSYKEVKKVTQSLSDRAGPRNGKVAFASARWDSLHHLQRSQPSCESCGFVPRPQIRGWRLAEVREAVVGHTAGEEQSSGQTRPPDWPSLSFLYPTRHNTTRDERENWVREEKRVFTEGMDGYYSTMQMQMPKTEASRPSPGRKEVPNTGRRGPVQGTL